MAADPYRTLQVPPHASDDVVKAAYRRLAALYHPDRNPGFQAAATQRLQDINEAYEVIRAARLNAAREAAANAKAERQAEAEARAQRDADAALRAEREARAKARTDRKAAREKADAHARRVRAVRAESRRVATEASLQSIGFLSARYGPSDEIVVEFLASVLPDGAEIMSCMRYGSFAANRSHNFPTVSRRLLRTLPPTTAGWSATPAPRLRPTQIVVCTKRLLLWTTGDFDASDGVVVEECVTAHTVRFAEILEADVGRKGVVGILVENGPTLIFRVAEQHAPQLGSYVERALGSASD